MTEWITGEKEPVKSQSGFKWDAKGAEADRLDAYALWPEMSEFRAVLTQGDGKVRVTLDLADGGKALKELLDAAPSSSEARQTASKPARPSIDVEPHYRAQLSSTDGKRRIITARLRWADAAQLIDQCKISRLRLHATNRQTLVKAARRGLQPVGMTIVQLKGQTPKGKIPVDDVMVTPEQKLAHKDKLAKGPGGPNAPNGPSDPSGASGKSALLDGVVMGFVDFGCAFAHPRFRAGPGHETRIEFLWDQGRGMPTEPGCWRPEFEFGYGREATRERLNAVMAQAAADRSRFDRDAERACYRATGQDEITDDSQLHGTAVMDVAVGEDVSASTGNTSNLQAAPKLVFVQLPLLAIDDLSGGWLSAYLIDGIEYILSKCSPEAKVVITISLGSYGGSHDGGSLIETALDDFCQRRPNDFALVLAAGNAPRRVDEHPRHIHGQCTLAKGESRSFQWVVPADDATQNSLEIWHQAVEDGMPSSIRCTVQAPDDKMVSVDEGQHALLMATGQAVAAVYNRAAGSPGTSGVTVISTGPTRSGLEHWPTPAPGGRWLVTIANTGEYTICAHAWVERDDPDRNDIRRDLLQSWLADMPDGEFVDEEYTLTGQATAELPIVVGNVESGHVKPTAAPDSARGPSRGKPMRIGPDISAIGSGIDRAGIPVASDLGGDRWAARGTSIAAPVVARQIARLLAAAGKSRPLSRNHLIDQLLGQYKREKQDEQLGWGSIDLQGQPIPPWAQSTAAGSQGLHPGATNSSAGDSSNARMDWMNSAA